MTICLATIQSAVRALVHWWRKMKYGRLRGGWSHLIFRFSFNHFMPYLRRAICPWTPNITMCKITEILWLLVLSFQLQMPTVPLHLMYQGWSWAGGKSSLYSPLPKWDRSASLLFAGIQFLHISVGLLSGMKKAMLFDYSELGKVLEPSLNDWIPQPLGSKDGSLTCSCAINSGQKPQVGVGVPHCQALGWEFYRYSSLL